MLQLSGGGASAEAVWRLSLLLVLARLPSAAQQHATEAKLFGKFLCGSSFLFSALVSPKLLLPSDRRKNMKDKLAPFLQAAANPG